MFMKIYILILSSAFITNVIGQEQDSGSIINYAKFITELTEIAEIEMNIDKHLKNPLKNDQNLINRRFKRSGIENNHNKNIENIFRQTWFSDILEPHENNEKSMSKIEGNKFHNLNNSELKNDFHNKPILHTFRNQQGNQDKNEKEHEEYVHDHMKHTDGNQNKKKSNNEDSKTVGFNWETIVEVDSKQSGEFLPEQSFDYVQESKENSKFSTFDTLSEEIEDKEWETYLNENWRRHGIIPEAINSIPKYLINVNYPNHQCVHLGNNIEDDVMDTTPHVSFPAIAEFNSSFILVDLDHELGHYIKWMVINIPDDDIKRGHTTVEYPGGKETFQNRNQNNHRNLFLTFQEEQSLSKEDRRLPRATKNQDSGRNIFNIKDLITSLGLSHPIAGNYYIN